MKDNRIGRWIKEEEVVIQHRTEAGHVIESQLSLVMPFPWYQVAWTTQCFSSMYTLPIGNDLKTMYLQVPDVLVQTGNSL